MPVVRCDHSGPQLTLSTFSVQDEFFVASDVTPLVPHTRNVFYLDDDEMAIISRSGIITKTIFNKPIEKTVQKVTFDIEDIDKAGFDHYMLKEIFEQPDTILDAMRGRLMREEGLVKLGGLAEVEDLMATRRYNSILNDILIRAVGFIVLIFVLSIVYRIILYRLRLVKAASRTG